MGFSLLGKYCKNCVYWQGKRTQMCRGANWETESPGVRARCAANVFTGNSTGPCACDGQNCSKFVELPK